MGEAIKKGASHFFKKAHDGFEAWIDFLNPESSKYESSFAGRYLQPAVFTVFGAAALWGFGYEMPAILLNNILDINLPTPIMNLQAPSP